MNEKNKIGLGGYILVRGFGWSMVSLVFVFVFNTFLTLSQEWPGVTVFVVTVLEPGFAKGYLFWTQGIIQILLYIGGVSIPFLWPT